MRWSFNILIFSSLLTAFGCGVKSSPVPPKGTMLPSYVDKFLDSSAEEQKKETEIKNEKTQSSQNP